MSSETGPKRYQKLSSQGPLELASLSLLKAVCLLHSSPGPKIANSYGLLIWCDDTALYKKKTHFILLVQSSTQDPKMELLA